MIELQHATTLEYAREAPPEEITPTLLKAHAAQEVRLREEARGMPSASSELAAVFYGLGAGVRPGRIGDGTIRPAPRGRRQKAVAWISGIGAFLVLAAAIIGMSVFMGGGTIYVGPNMTRIYTSGEFFNASVRLVVAMVCFWIACLLPIGTLIEWVRTRRVRSHAHWASQFLVIPFAVVSLLAINSEGVPIERFWLPPVLPVWLALTLSTLTFLVTVFGSRGLTEEENRQKEKDDRRRIMLVDEPNFGKLAEAREKLPEPVLEELLATRNAGVWALAEREIISAADAKAAEDHPFGRLTWG